MLALLTLLSKPFFSLELTADELRPARRPDLLGRRLIEEIRQRKRVTVYIEGFPLSRPDPEALRRLSRALHPFNAFVCGRERLPTDDMTPRKWEELKRKVNSLLEFCHRHGVVVCTTVDGHDFPVIASKKLTPDDDPPTPEELRVSSEGKRFPKSSLKTCFTSERLWRKARLICRKVFSAFNYDGVNFSEVGMFSGYCYCDRCRRRFREFVLRQLGSEERVRQVLGVPLTKLRPPAPEERFKRRREWYFWLKFNQSLMAEATAKFCEYAQEAALRRWGKRILSCPKSGHLGPMHPWAGWPSLPFMRRKSVDVLYCGLTWQFLQYHRCLNKLNRPFPIEASFKSIHEAGLLKRSESAGKPIWSLSLGAKQQPAWAFELETYSGLMGTVEGFGLECRGPETLEGARRAFSFILSHQDLFAGADPSPHIAIYNSYEQYAYEFFGLRHKSAMFASFHLYAMWYVLNRRHIPVGYITDLGELERFKVLVLDEVRNMSEEEARLIRDWVREGGILLALGAVSANNLFEEPRPQYLLADVLGIERPSERREECAKLVVADAKALRSFSEGESLRYGWRLFYHYKMPPKLCRYGYALFPRRGVRLLARWGDGSPAIIAHRYGKGLCIYSGAFPQFLGLDKGSKLACDLLSWALGGRLQLRTNLPPSCDIEVLRKEGKILVHLLNLEDIEVYDPTKALCVGNIKLIPLAPPRRNIEVDLELPRGFVPKKCYAVSPDFEGAKRLKFVVRNGRARFALPSLRMYAVVVLEG